MKTLLQYIIESKANPTSDDAIYYKLGLHKALWQKENLDFNPETASRETIIKYAKEKLVPFLKDSEEIIHRKDWDLDGLIGETEYQLIHPHYWTLIEWIFKDHKKQHDVLTVYECSNSKPYSMSKQRKQLFTDKYSAFTDNCCIGCPGIIPLEYSHFYPYRYDEWNHSTELPDTAKKYTWVCTVRFLTYIKKLGYKNIITMFQTPHLQEWAQNLYDNDIEGAKTWLHIVNNPEFDKKMISKYKSKFNGSKGLVHQRMVVMPEFRARYERLLKESLNASEQKEFDKLLKIIKDGDKKALEEFNKEHNVEPYDITKGTSDSFKMLTPENATVKTKVSKYESYINKFQKDIDDRYKEALDDKEYHKHRIIMTPLDLLMDYNNDKFIDDLDKEYWNMSKALKNLSSNINYKPINSYCYVYEPLIKEISMENIKKYTNKLGITQFNDKRRVKPDK